MMINVISLLNALRSTDDFVSSTFELISLFFLKFEAFSDQVLVEFESFWISILSHQCSALRALSLCKN